MTDIKLLRCKISISAGPEEGGEEKEGAERIFRKKGPKERTVESEDPTYRERGVLIKSSGLFRNPGGPVPLRAKPQGISRERWNDGAIKLSSKCQHRC